MKAAIALLLLIAGCDTPVTTVIFENDYATSTSRAYVVYRAEWQAVTLAAPISPGASSDPEDTVPASANTAYAVVAPGWSPSSTAPPTSFVVLQSRAGYSVLLDESVTIPIDDGAFLGDCAASEPLTQDEADFITQRVFQADFTALTYDAATCTTASAP